MACSAILISCQKPFGSKARERRGSGRSKPPASHRADQPQPQSSLLRPAHHFRPMLVPPLIAHRRALRWHVPFLPHRSRPDRRLVAAFGRTLPPSCRGPYPILSCCWLLAPRQPFWHDEPQPVLDRPRWFVANNWRIAMTRSRTPAL